MADPVAAALSRAHHESWAALTAQLVARFHRLELVEDALADAFEQATRHWPVDGVPANPAGWLHTTARRRALDRLRGEDVRRRRNDQLVELRQEQERREVAAQRVRLEEAEESGPATVLREEVLRLLFLCCHPTLSVESRAALTLRLVLGLPTRQIARLFLVSESTMAARLTRARQKLTRSGVALTLPDPDRLGARVEDVLRVVYLAFTAGYAPAEGEDVVAVDLSAEAVRLGRLLDGLLPGRADVGALLTLMLLQHSRRDARVSPQGELVLLPDQDRTRWHHDEIDQGLARLAAVAAPSDGWPLELYLQALVAAEHAGSPAPEQTDWARIAGVYARLEDLTGSAVVRLNRAVAVAEAEGPDAGLRVLEPISEEDGLGHRLVAVRGELLSRLGRGTEAVQLLQQAIQRCPYGAEREHLVRRVAAVSRDAASG